MHGIFRHAENMSAFLEQNSHAVDLVLVPTKYCVGLFFFREHFGTLPPGIIVTSVSLDPTFHHGLCASTSSKLSGALAALSLSTLALSLPSSSSSNEYVVDGGVSSSGSGDALLSRRQ